MIKQLKKAAKFLEIEDIIDWTDDWSIFKEPESIGFETFEPHKDICRYFLVEMLKKFTQEQWQNYHHLMFKEWKHIKIRDSLKYEFGQWKDSASSDISFKCIMSVIEGE